MGDAWDVLCPSGRVGFSPNPRVSQQETPRLLITEPPVDLLSAQTQRPLPQENKSAQCTHNIGT